LNAEDLARRPGRADAWAKPTGDDNYEQKDTNPREYRYGFHHPASNQLPFKMNDYPPVGTPGG
jgi:hypothetical protein